MNWNFLLALFPALALSAQERRPSVAELESAVRDRLEAARVEHGFPGACAAFVLPDRRLGRVAVGFVDAERESPLTVEHRMLSGSIGKTYVAAVALQLVAEDTLELDARIAAYLDDCAWLDRLPNHDSITVRMLLNHTSGIPEHVLMPEFAEAVLADPDRVWPPEEIVGFVLDEEPLFAAGEGWSYADTNYVLLGVVLERVTRKPWFDLLRTRLLEPLGLAETTPSDRRDLQHLANGFASGIAFHRGPTVVDGRYFVNPQFEYCGGGVCSTTADLARWCKALFDGNVIPEALRAQQLDGVEAPRVGGRYGLGITVRDTPHGQARGHSGIMPGYLSQMNWYPKLGLAVAVQFNTDDGRRLGASPAAWSDRIAAIVGTARR
jgi:D-alanyl-D-alanine carboxypeptidase